MYLRVLDKMRLLTEGLATHLTTERLLSRVRSQVNFDVGLVEEPSIADRAPVYGLLLAESFAVDNCGGRRCSLAPRPVLGLLGGSGGVRKTDLKLWGGPRAVHRVVTHKVRGGDDMTRWTMRQVLGGRGW